MAGCRPEYLPVIGAAIEAVAAGEFNLLGIRPDRIGDAGGDRERPVAGAIGMNAAGNALGPGNRANATIGRAVRLVLQNVGGAIPGVGDMATLGQPGKYTFCFAENEAESPWPRAPRRARLRARCERGDGGGRGRQRSRSWNRAAPAPKSSIHTYAHSMLIAGTISMSGYIGGGEPLIIMPPEHAVFLSQCGYTKDR